MMILSIPVLANQRQKINVVVEHWPPWEVAIDEHKKNVTKGIAIEILKDLFQRLDIDITLKTAPWKRALAMIKEGKADLIPMIVGGENRQEYMLFTIPIYKEPVVFVYSKKRLKSFEWNSWQDLKPFKIGVTNGYAYGDFNNAIKQYGLKTQGVTSDRQNFEKLKFGRVDIIPMYYANYIETIKGHQHLAQFNFAKKSVSESVYYFGISKKSFLASRITDINNTLQKMKDDGSFKRILNGFYIEKK